MPYKADAWRRQGGGSWYPVHAAPLDRWCRADARHHGAAMMRPRGDVRGRTQHAAARRPIAESFRTEEGEVLWGSQVLGRSTGRLQVVPHACGHKRSAVSLLPFKPLTP